MKNKYFYKSNNFYHGIMFHNFYDNLNYSKGDGAISKKKFIDLINFIGKKNILNGDIFIKKIINKSIKKRQVCLTFDDSIKSQIKIALPILQKFKIKAIFFIHTSIFEENDNNLELFKYFRLNYPGGKKKYYNDFTKLVNKFKDINNFLSIHKYEIKKKKKLFPFYSLNDIKFRLIRDQFLNPSTYKRLNLELMKKKNFSKKKIVKNLFFSKNDLEKIINEGHIIGLHSHNHPTFIQDLKYNDQKREYKKNLISLKKLFPKIKKINCMAHPCGSYNAVTLNILDKLKIKVGFKQIMKIESEKKMKKINNSNLEIAREDAVNIINRMKV
jgi:peptidoglycan/xylan/chitin deacetylase (PgdA/CDA1 family)